VPYLDKLTFQELINNLTFFWGVIDYFYGYLSSVKFPTTNTVKGGDAGNTQIYWKVTSIDCYRWF